MLFGAPAPHKMLEAGAAFQPHDGRDVAGGCGVDGRHGTVGTVGSFQDGL